MYSCSASGKQAQNQFLLKLQLQVFWDVFYCSIKCKKKIVKFQGNYILKLFYCC